MSKKPQKDQPWHRTRDEKPVAGEVVLVKAIRPRTGGSASDAICIYSITHGFMVMHNGPCLAPNQVLCWMRFPEPPEEFLTC